VQDVEEVDDLCLRPRNTRRGPERVVDEDLPHLIYRRVRGTERIGIRHARRSGEDVVVARAGLIEMEWPGALEDDLGEQLRAPREQRRQHK
jgi:hypothetical protein